MVLEKTLESPLDCKEIQPVHPKGDQSWVFIGRADVEAETPILWPLITKSWLIRKDPDAGKDWGQEEKGTTEDEVVGWHHWLDDMGLGGPWDLLMDKEAWRAAVHGVEKTRTWLRDWIDWLIERSVKVTWTVVCDPTSSSRDGLCVQLLNCVWLFATLQIVACQPPLSIDFSRQKYGSELPFPSPGDLLIWGLNQHLLCLLHW